MATPINNSNVILMEVQGHRPPVEGSGRHSESFTFPLVWLFVSFMYVAHSQKVGPPMPHGQLSFEWVMAALPPSPWFACNGCVVLQS